MRATMHQFLVAQAPLVAIVPAGRWYQVGAVVDKPVRPFAVERWIAPVPLAGRGWAYQLRLDVHDTRGSYANIDALNRAVRTALEGVQQLVGVDGRISQCDFLGYGGDQEDETYGTNFSFSSWQVIGVAL